MYVTWQMILSGFVAICVGFAAICVAVSWCIKIFKGIKKPADDINSKVKDHKERLDQQDEKIDKLDKTLDYLVNANNLVIRTLFTVLGELAVNNDQHGNCKKAQNEIQKFLTPVEGQHDVV